MKGGSIASDAVTGLVDKATYQQMNVRFDNKVGGGCGCGKVGGRCALHSHQKKSGGNLLKQIFGNSTANAFKGGNGSCGASKQTGGQMPSIHQMMASNSSLDFSIKNRQSGGKAKPKAKKPTVAKKTTPKKKIVMKGGFFADGKVVLTDVAPKVNLETISWSPKTAPSATATEIFATEGVHTLPLMQKTTTYGQVSSTFDSPFSYGSTAPGSRLVEPMKPIVGSVVSGANIPSSTQAGGKKTVKKAAKKVVVKKAKAVKPDAAKKRTTKKH